MLSASALSVSHFQVQYRTACSISDDQPARALNRDLPPSHRIEPQHLLIDQPFASTTVQLCNTDVSSGYAGQRKACKPTTPCAVQYDPLRYVLHGTK